MRGSVDTTTWVYLRQDQDQAKRNAAHLWIETLGSLGGLVTSRQVVREFYAVGMKRRPVGAAHEALRADAREISVFAVDRQHEDDFELAWMIEARYRLQFWDALILAAAHRAGCAICLTEDLNPGQRYLDVTAVNPFTTTPQTALRP